MKNRLNNFLRQTIKISPQPKASQNPNFIRIKFLEHPYRIIRRHWFRQKGTIIALILTFLIPTVIYKCIVTMIKFEEKGKLNAEMTDNYFEIKEILDGYKK